MLYRTTTTEDDGHSHHAAVDENGNGSTSEGRDGHQHEIVAFQVQPGGADGHTHGLHLDLRPE